MPGLAGFAAVPSRRKKTGCVILSPGAGALPSFVTFTRASGATVINSSGAMTPVGNDVARIAYNGSTLSPLGFVAELQRTNLLLNSSTLATQSVTVSATAYTLSFYGSGTVTLSGAYTGSLVGSGAYPTRSKLTFTPSAGSLTLTVSGTVQYANLEAGSFETSWIPTTGASATRTVDITSITPSSIGYNTSEGTWLIDAYVPDVAAAALIGGRIGTGATRFHVQVLTDTNGGCGVFLTNGTTTQTVGYASGGKIGLSARARVRVAYTYKCTAGGLIGTLYVNGSKLATVTTAAIVTPISWDDLMIGHRLNGVYTDWNCQPISAVEYLPRVLTDAEAISKTGL